MKVKGAASHSQRQVLRMSLFSPLGLNKAASRFVVDVVTVVFYFILAIIRLI
jgi:hypothetical protein